MEQNPIIDGPRSKYAQLVKVCSYCSKFCSNKYTLAEILLNANLMGRNWRFGPLHSDGIRGLSFGLCNLRCARSNPSCFGPVWDLISERALWGDLGVGAGFCYDWSSAIWGCESALRGQTTSIFGNFWPILTNIWSWLQSFCVFSYKSLWGLDLLNLWKFVRMLKILF